jgi:hypothetical protein
MMLIISGHNNHENYTAGECPCTSVGLNVRGARIRVRTVFALKPPVCVPMDWDLLGSGSGEE